MTVTVVRSRALPTPTAVTYSVGGTATPGADYSIDASPAVIPAGEAAGTIEIVPVDDGERDPDETIVLTLTSATGGQLGPRSEFTLTLLDATRLRSDDFNRCGLDPVWSFVDPVGGASVETRGAGTEDAQLRVGVPAGTRNLFDDLFTVPYVVQAVADSDFEMEVKFDSSVADPIRDQGILVLQDLANWARVDFFATGSQLRLYAATTTASVSTVRYDQPIGNAGASPTWLRVRRQGDVWTFFWSTDGSTFTEASSFVFPLALTQAGVYAGNVGDAFTMVVDYVFSTDDPIFPEDGGVVPGPAYQLNVAPLGGGSVLVDADQELYFCGDTVTLTAIPQPGWGFDRWEGDLSGDANPEGLAMTADRQVDAVFVPVPLTAEFALTESKVAEAGGPVPVEVRLAYAAPAEVTVSYTARGTASDPEDYTIDPSPLVIPAGQSSGEIVVSPVDELDPDLGETVVLALTGSTGAGLGAQLEHTVTLVDDDQTVVVSDDFNRCELSPIWSFDDPLDDATLETRGAGTEDAQLVLAVPAGVHNLFDSTFTVPRVTQSIPDGDFAIEARFDSLVSESIQDQGVIVFEDLANWARFDFFSLDGTLRLFAATTVDGESTQRLDLPLGAPAAPVWMRVVRTLDSWALSWSSDGVSFTPATSFSFPLAPNEAGVYVGNLGPAHTMAVDYFFDATEPIVPEDGAVPGEIGRTLSVGVSGSGTVTRTPEQALYYCDEPVELTAVPDPGWVFYRWTGDLSGGANPASITLSADRSVTAVFLRAVPAPGASARDAVGP